MGRRARRAVSDAQGARSCPGEGPIDGSLGADVAAAGQAVSQGCGKPTDGDDHEHIPTGQLLGYAPLIYTAEFPLSSLSALRGIKGVYWRYHIAGRLVNRVPGSETVLVEIRLKPKFSRSAVAPISGYSVVAETLR